MRIEGKYSVRVLGMDRCNEVEEIKLSVVHISGNTYVYPKLNTPESVDLKHVSLNLTPLNERRNSETYYFSYDDVIDVGVISQHLIPLEEKRLLKSY